MNTEVAVSVPPGSECVIDMFSRYSDINKFAAELSESEKFRKHELALGLDALRANLQTMPLFKQQAVDFQWFRATDILDGYSTTQMTFLSLRNWPISLPIKT